MDLTFDVARKMVTRAMEEAEKRYGRPICVAVCDRQGSLVAFARMDGTPERSAGLSRCKAYTAARMRMDSAAFDGFLREQNIPISYYCDPKFTGIPGGCVLKGADGNAVGGVGVSGLAAAEDAAIADIAAHSMA